MRRNWTLVQSGDLTLVSVQRRAAAVGAACGTTTEQMKAQSEAAAGTPAKRHAPWRELQLTQGAIFEDPSNANSRAEAASRTTPTWSRTVCLSFGKGTGHPVSRLPSTRSPRSHRESTAPQARDATGDATRAVRRSNLALAWHVRPTPCHKTAARESRLVASFSSATTFRSGWSRR